MARNHDVASDFDLAASALPSAEEIHFNIVSISSTDVEQNHFDNNLSAGSGDACGPLATLANGARTVSPTDNVSVNLLESNGDVVRRGTEVSNGDADGDAELRRENELDAESAPADALDGPESETSDDNNERERVFDVHRLKNLRALDANLDFGELDNGHAAFSAPPQFASAFWTAHSSRTRRTAPERARRAHVASNSLVPRLLSEPSSVTEDFIDESCESSSVSAASENADPEQSESSNDELSASASARAVDAPCSSHRVWRTPQNEDAPHAHDGRSSRKRPRRSATASREAMSLEDGDSDADDEEEHDTEADAEGARRCESERPCVQLDAAVRQNDLNSWALGEASDMQNDLSDMRPAASDASGTTRPKALGDRRPMPSGADECDSNVMSPSQLMDALRCVADSPGPSTLPSTACTCDCAPPHPLNVTSELAPLSLSNGCHVCLCSLARESQSRCSLRLPSMRSERRAAFACALHGTSSLLNSTLESTLTTADLSLVPTSESTCKTSSSPAADTMNGRTSCNREGDCVAESESVRSRMANNGSAEQRNADKDSQSNSTGSINEKVLIWSEYEAYISQVKQVGSSACGPTAVINVLKSFDLLEFCDDKRRVETYVHTRRRAERASLLQYLRSRACAGTTAQQLLAGVRRLTAGRVEGRFFATFPERRFALSAWLASWMRRGATPLATLNLQRAVPPGYAVPDAWHHQMVFGVGPKGVYLTNPLETVPETVLRQQLASDSVLLVRKADLVARWHAHHNQHDFDLSELLNSPEYHSDSDQPDDDSETDNCRRDDAARRPVDPRWRDMNVLGQVVHTLRTAHAPAFAGFLPEYAHHVCIPATYRAGITLFVRTDNLDALQALRDEPELPLLLSADSSAASPLHSCL